MRLRRHHGGGTEVPPSPPGLHVVPAPLPIDAETPAPALPFSWGDLAELWTLLHLYPTGANTSACDIVDAAFANTFGESLTLGDIMGMYDREENFEEKFKVGDRVVLTAMRHIGAINTRFGPAEKVLITVVTRKSYPSATTYSAIGQGFAAQAQASTPADFPHVAEYVRVRLPSGNEVKRFMPVPGLPAGKEGCAAWVKGNDGGKVVVEHAVDESGATGGNAPVSTVDF